MAFVEECKKLELTPEMAAWALNSSQPALCAKVWRKHNLERVYMAMGLYIEFKDGIILPLSHTMSAKRVNLEAMENYILNADYSKFVNSQRKTEAKEWCFGAADEESF